MKDIPDGSVYAIISDPPYNISRDNNFTTMGRASIDFGEWDKDFDVAKQRIKNTYNGLNNIETI